MKPVPRLYMQPQVCYVSKKSKKVGKSNFDRNPLPKMNKMKKNMAKDYLKEDPFPQDKEELKKLTKLVNIKDAFGLSEDNPYKQTIDSIEKLNQSFQKEEPDIPDPTDDYIKKAMESRASYNQKRNSTKEKDALSKMASIEALSKKTLERKLAQYKEKNVGDLSFKLNDTEEKVIFKQQQENIDFSKNVLSNFDDAMKSIELSKSSTQKLLEPLNIRHMKRELSTDYASILSNSLKKNLEDKDENNQNYQYHNQMNTNSIKQKPKLSNEQMEYNNRIDEKIKRFEERTKESDPIIFGYAKDDKKFNSDKFRDEGEFKEQGKKFKSKLEEKKKEKERKKNLNKEEEMDSEWERFPGEDSDAAHTNIYYDIPLTPIEKEIIEEQRLEREKKEEAKRIAQQEKHGDAYITDIEIAGESEEESVYRQRIADARQKIEDDIIEKAIEKPDEQKDYIEIIDNTLMVRGVAVPDVNQKFLDNIYGRMPLRERRRMERRMANEELRLKRKQRKHSQSKRYIYDGDSQFTRRQLQIGELISKYLSITLNLSQFRELDGFGVIIEDVAVNRELSSATIFWQSSHYDIQEVYDALKKLQPQIRKEFAKMTSSLKISPNLVFIKKDTVENIERAQELRTQLLAKRKEILSGETAAKEYQEHLQFMNSPLSPEMIKKYGVQLPESNNLHGSIVRDMYEEKAKYKIIREEAKLKYRDSHMGEILKESKLSPDEVANNAIENNKNDAEPFYKYFSLNHEIDSRGHRREFVDKLKSIKEKAEREELIQDESDSEFAEIANPNIDDKFFDDISDVDTPVKGDSDDELFDFGKEPNDSAIDNDEEITEMKRLYNVHVKQLEKLGKNDGKPKRKLPVRLYGEGSDAEELLMRDSDDEEEEYRVQREKLKPFKRNDMDKKDEDEFKNDIEIDPDNYVFSDAYDSEE